MQKQHVIGMFDSGVGGLTVMQEILAHFPQIRVVYFGDTARVPYGNRTMQELLNFGEEIIAFLISQGAEGIVAACNTSSATVLPMLKERFSLPIIGMIEPGSRLAVEETRNGRIGLIATEATVKSRAYGMGVSKALGKGILPNDEQLSQAWSQGGASISLVEAQACPLFVPLIEAGLANSEEARGIAKAYLAPLQQAQVDTLILGCTHYPFLNSLLRELMPEVTLVDPAQAVMEELVQMLSILDQDELRNEAGDKKNSYYVSGDPDLFQKVGNTLLKGIIDEVKQVHWGCSNYK